ncbi:MAG: hypothetical protein WC869_11880 [Phycisphaerae bacterium]|jgi:hypothetical protein
MIWVALAAVVLLLVVLAYAHARDIRRDMEAADAASGMDDFSAPEGGRRH